MRVLFKSGHFQLVLKSDDEPLIVALKDLKERAMAVATEQHRISVIPEMSPVADSQSNGLAEVAVREVKGVSLSLLFDLTERYSVGHAILVWLVSYAAAIITRGPLGAGGLTA